MKRKIRLLSTICALCIGIAVAVFGVFSAISLSYGINGTIQYVVRDVFVSVNARMYKSTVDDLTSVDDLVAIQTALVNSTSSSTLNANHLIDTNFHLSGGQDTTYYTSFDSTTNSLDNSGKAATKTISNVPINYGSLEYNSSLAYAYYIVVEVTNFGPQPAGVVLTTTLGNGANSNYVASNSDNVAGKTTTDVVKRFVVGLALNNPLVSVTDVDLSINLSISAETVTTSDVSYSTVNNSYNVVTGYTGNATTLTIPSTYNSKNVTKIADNALKNNTTLTAVTLPNTLTTIGANSFNGCTSLNNVEIPAQVSSIGSGAFAGCTSLTTMTVEATTPPTLADTTSLSSATTTIHVHSANRNTYRNANIWSNYYSILTVMDGEVDNLFYIDTSDVLWWNEGDAVTYVCLCNTSNEDWIWTNTTFVQSNLYSFTIEDVSLWTTVIVVRLAPYAGNPSWENKWNHSSYIYIYPLVSGTYNTIAINTSGGYDSMGYSLYNR